MSKNTTRMREFQAPPMSEYWGSDSEWVVARGFKAHQASKHRPKVIWAMIISMCTAWMPGAGPDVEESHAQEIARGNRAYWISLAHGATLTPAALFGASLEGISFGDGL